VGGEAQGQNMRCVLTIGVTIDYGVTERSLDGHEWDNDAHLSIRIAASCKRSLVRIFASIDSSAPSATR
jgi:hypothetical protein